MWRLAFVAFVASSCLLLVHLWRNVKSEAQLRDVRRSCFHPDDSFGGFSLLVAFLLRLPRNLHFGVHKVLCLPRNLHFKAHKSTAPATKSALQGPQSTEPATKFALQRPHSTAPATKSALQGPKYCTKRKQKRNKQIQSAAVGGSQPSAISLIREESRKTSDH